MEIPNKEYASFKVILVIFIFLNVSCLLSLAKLLMDLLRIFLVEFLTGSLRALNPDVFYYGTY